MMLVDNEIPKLKRSNSDIHLDINGILAEPEPKQEDLEEKKKIMETSKKLFQSDVESHKLRKLRRHSSLNNDKKNRHLHNNYINMKVYSISNCSSRERLKKKMTESIFNDSVQIDWAAIME